MEPHDHSHLHSHHHAQKRGLMGWIASIFHLHGHSHDEQISLIADPAFNANETGIRTVWLALLALAVTSILQIIS